MVAIKEAQASCLVFGNPEPVFSVLKLAAPYFLPLDTKYYTCLVQFETRDFACNNVESSLPVNAIIINGPLEEAKSLVQSSSFLESDVRLFCCSSPSKEIFDFALEHQVEIVDIETEPERVLEALESSIWPGAKMKLPSDSPPVPQNGSAQNQSIREPREVFRLDRFDDDFEDLLESDQAEMATIFSMVSQARTQGANLSDEDRRNNAERVLSAITKMLGEDLDLDS